ncbi:SDR family oxidoreductase [Paenibacillus glufosinatiresistens]|uniref:SDR family oxidoreductase n=1 Tax=Paenibacillus glufosinatiresistens TaxID=3070657 RepID=UPI00286D8EF8|nr:SDR family oxidoreductase [Paenibacillus sp. YX.27]
MSILVTGFNGKVGREVANKLEHDEYDFVNAVRNVEKARSAYGDRYRFVRLDLSDSSTFRPALTGIDRIFLMYPPGDAVDFAGFIEAAKKAGVRHIVYLSLKDIQYLPFIHHYRNEKLIRRSGIPFTFLRAGYFMQNLNDFLRGELVKNNRIFVAAGKGRTSFVDARDLAEAAVEAFNHPDRHQGRAYVLTGEEAPDFYEVAEAMTGVLGRPITYANPSVKDFKAYMLKQGTDPAFVNVVVGIHIPTKLGLAKGIRRDYETMTGRKPTKLKQYLEDHRDSWM